jgi:hypothetical protein
MDESCEPSEPILAPDAIVWAIERLKPSLVRPLHETGRTDKLVELLRHYDSLRKAATELRTQSYLKACDEYDFMTDGWSPRTLEDILYALAEGSWECSDQVARDSISLVVFSVYNRDANDDTSQKPPPTLPSPLLFDIPGLDDSEFGASDELDPNVPSPLSIALRHARKQLLALDTGYDEEFWSKIYTSVVGDWLDEDHPDVAAEIVATGTVSQYFGNVWIYVKQMQEVERLWIRISRPIRTLLRTVQNETEALQVIEHFVREDGTNDAEVAAWARRTWEMVKRRDSALEQPTSLVTCSDEWNAEVDHIRSAFRGGSTCYVIVADALPQTLRPFTDEKSVLAVRLPERWLRAENVLAEPAHLERFYWTNSSIEDTDLILSINRSFWCSNEYLWPQLFRFGRSVPVLFVFKNKCILARYRFNHFSDLRAVSEVSLKHLPTFEISDAQWENDRPAERCTLMLPDEPPTRPAIFTNLVNRSTVLAGQSLRKAYLSENPGAEKSLAERLIQRLLS